MAAPDIILSKGQVLLQQSNSVLGIVPIADKIRFGIVSLVYETSDKTAIGNYVMYDSTKGVPLMYGSTMYVLIDEQYLTGQETAPP